MEHNSENTQESIDESIFQSLKSTLEQFQIIIQVDAYSFIIQIDSKIQYIDSTINFSKKQQTRFLEGLQEENISKLLKKSNFFCWNKDDKTNPFMPYLPESLQFQSYCLIHLIEKKFVISLLFFSNKINFFKNKESYLYLFINSLRVKFLEKEKLDKEKNIQSLEKRLREEISKRESLTQELKQEITFHDKSVKALNEKEAIYKIIFDKNTAIKLLVEQDTGHIIDANLAAEHFYKYSIPELQKMNIKQLDISSNLPLSHVSSNKEVSEQEYITCKHRIRNGDIRDVEIYYSPMQIQNISFLYCIIHDITEKKKAEDALKSSEKRFRTIIETANEGIMLIDEKSIIHECNPKLGEIFGRDIKDIIGKSILSFLNFDNQKIVLEQLQKRRTGRQAHYELTITQPSGIQLHCSVNASPLYNEDKDFLGSFALITDITSSKLTEKKLLHSERMFHSYFELSIIGMGIISSEEIWLEANKKLCSMLGYEKEELLKLSWRDLTFPRDLILETPYYNRMIQGKIDEYSLDKRFICKDGKIIFTIMSIRCIRDINGKIDYLITQILDITERKTLEEKFKQFIEYSPDPLIIINQDGMISLVNNQTEELFGYKREDILGKPIDIIIPQRIREKHRQYVQFYFQNPRPRMMGSGRELTALHSKGFEFPVEVSLNYFKSKDETLVLSTIRDITERKQVEDKLRESEFKLKEAQSITNICNYEFDIRTGEVKWSEQAFKIFDINEKEEIPSLKEINAFIHPEDRTQVQQNMDIVINEKLPLNLEYRIITRENKLKYIHSMGTPIIDEKNRCSGIFGVLIDITERKLYEEKLLTRYKSEKFISRISSNLININPEEFTKEISHVFEELGQLLNVDRIYVFLFQDSNSFSLESHWKNKHAKAIPNTLEFPNSLYKEILLILNNLEIIKIINMQKKILSGTLKQYFFPDTVSTILVPMVEKKRALGFLGIDTVQEKKIWEEEDVELLKIVASVFVNTLSRTRVQVKLRESEQLFRTLVESTQDYSIIMLNNDGYINSWNTGAEKIKNYKSEEILGKHFSIFYLPEDTKNRVPEKELKTAEKEKHYENEGWRVRKDGTRFWANSIITPLYDSNGHLNGFSNVTRDITERKKSEERLNELLRERNIILENVDVGIAFLKNKKFIWVNTKMVELFGYHIDEIKNKGSEILYPSRENIIQSGRDPYQVLLEENIFNNERMMKRKDGSLFWTHTIWKNVDPNDFSQGTIWILEDITERKRVEDELRESEQRFRNMADNAPVLLWMSGSDGGVNYLNKTWLSFTGKSFAEESGFGWMEGLHSDDYSFRKKTLEESYVSRKSFQVEYRLLHRSGKYRWLLDSGVARFTPNGSFIGFIGSCLDITDLKNSERELIHAKEIAEEANKAKSIFLSNMTHELRTPLNAILGFSQILKRDEEISPKHKGFIEMMYNSGNHLLTIINDILDLSKIEAGHMVLEMEAFSIPEAIKEVMNMFYYKAGEKGLSLQADIAEDLPDEVIADVKRIRQVLINLVGNAVKFTSKGSIELRVKYRKLPGQDGNKYIEAYFYVIDTGRGIPNEEIKRIFQPFQQSSSQHSSGTGLGLSISSKLVKMMKGDLKVESKLGQGTTFSFSIPLLVGDTQYGIIKKERYSPVIGFKGEKRPKILIVDDILNNRQTLSILLSDVGFECIQAENGQDAIKVVETERPDLVFMDLKMPLLSGEEATKIIRQTEFGKSLPIIALTASGFNRKDDFLKESQLSEYLVKPFTEAEVFNSIQKFLGLEYIRRLDNTDNPGRGSKDIETIMKEALDMFLSLEIETRKELQKAIRSQDRKAIINILENLHFSESFHEESKMILIDKAKSYQYAFLLELSKKITK